MKEQNTLCVTRVEQKRGNIFGPSAVFVGKKPRFFGQAANQQV
jgi:hypothetical protein